MKPIGLILLAVWSASSAAGVFTPLSLAQETSTAAGRSGQSEASLAPGSAIPVELNSAIDSKKAKAGDMVTAHTSEALRSSDGRLILPRGTKVEGHITQASARNKGGNESALGIQFDKAMPKDGGEIPLNVIIQALAAPVSFSAPSDLGTPQTVGTTQTSPMRNAPPPTAPSAQPPSGGIEPDASPVRSQPLDAKSRGVIGLHGLALNAEPANDRPASVVVSNGKSVHLDGGTRMLLVVQGARSEPSGQ
jgi:hypothetical protein